MKIKIKLAAYTFNFDVCESDTIENVKAYIENKEHIQIEQQRIIYSGMLLQDYKTLADYGIQEDSMIHLVLRLRPG